MNESDINARDIRLTEYGSSDCRCSHEATCTEPAIWHTGEVLYHPLYAQNGDPAWMLLPDDTVPRGDQPVADAVPICRKHAQDYFVKKIVVARLAGKNLFRPMIFSGMTVTSMASSDFATYSTRYDEPISRINGSSK